MLTRLTNEQSKWLDENRDLVEGRDFYKIYNKMTDSKLFYWEQAKALVYTLIWLDTGVESFTIEVNKVKEIMDYTGRRSVTMDYEIRSKKMPEQLFSSSKIFYTNSDLEIKEKLPKEIFDNLIEAYYLPMPMVKELKEVPITWNVSMRRN